MNGDAKITPSHRARTALVYVRQSTLVQVRDHTESTQRQYGLAQVAVRLGWAPEDVVVVDADLGLSGRFGSQREGFRQLISRVCLGEVGAVLGLEMSRLARSSAEFARLLELARLTDTLLVDGDGVYDLADVNDRLLLGLKGTMSEAELHLLTGRLHGAKLAAAARGELRFPLPVGYVYDEGGGCVIDPDAEVRAAVADLFAAFAQTGSAYGVAGEFTGRAFPLPAYGGAWAGQLRLGQLTHARVLDALGNPCYAGVYVYGRSFMQRRVLADGSVRAARRYRPRAQWPLVVYDHHEGYITWQQFVDTEARLQANRTSIGARPPREGHPLCQGIISCGACGLRMGTCYRFGKDAAYDCAAARRDGAATPACRQVPAATVDQAVGGLLLAAVGPEQLVLALAAAEEVADRHTRSHRAAELAAERARYEAARAERAFSLVDPDNRLVACTLEARWEAKLAALAEAEAALQTAQASTPPLPEPDRLLALAADLPRLWHAPQTSPRDRKRLLRTLIADVTVIPQDDPALVRIGVRWHTGATTTDEALAAKLNAAGLHTGKHRPFTATAVHRVRAAHQLRAPRTVPLREGEITVPDAAARLKVSASAVYYWLSNGQLPARQAPSGRWCIPWDPKTEAAYRAQVAASFRLKPRTQPAPERGAV